MHFLTRAGAALLIGALASATLVAPALAQACLCPTMEGAAFSGPVIQADEPPPPLPEYEQPPMPAPGYTWTPGYWAWNNDDYFWAPGVWVEPPQPGLLWTPAYWAFVGGVYYFHRGYWAPHVGFYGGVNYGYGYNGLGYEGGRWENGRFSYNATVNNFGAVRVADVYRQPVTVPPGAGRASYAGGPGGNLLKPTPEQEQVAAEPHVRPTPAQFSQVRAASVNAEQFQAANKGKPAVAATIRAGELKGEGVVPATAAGAAQTVPTKAEEKLAPGVRPVPGVATPPGGKPLPGAAGQTLPAEKPLAAPGLEKMQMTLPPRTPPGGAKERPAGEKPNGPEKAQSLQKPATPETPKALENKPRGVAKPSPGLKPVVPAAPGRPSRLDNAPRPALTPKAAPVGADRRAPRPGERGRRCGKPGLPPCSR